MDIVHGLKDKLEGGLGEGPLTLAIVCTLCEAEFEINKESFALAFLTGASFVEYVKFVQSSKCPKCGNGGESK